MDLTNAHFPYTAWVPDYQTAAYDRTGVSSTDFYMQLDSALGTYRSGLLASSATRLEKSLQLVGIARFTATNHAIVTSRVTRSGNYGADCVLNDGFSYQ